MKNHYRMSLPAPKRAKFPKPFLSCVVLLCLLIAGMASRAQCTASVQAGGATSFCQGGSVTLTASEGDAYLWSNGETTSSITVTESGNYTVTVTRAGCTSVSTPVAVTVNPVPVFNYFPTLNFCSNENVTYLATTGPVIDVLNPAGTFLTGDDSIKNVMFRPSLASPGPGSFTVVFTSGCSATFSYELMPAPTLVLTRTTFSACTPGTVDLRTAVSPESILPPGTLIEYFFNGLRVQNPAAVDAPGNYVIHAISPLGCESERSVRVSFNNLSIPDASVMAAGVDPNTVYLGYHPAESITLTAVPEGGTAPYTYLWSTGQTGSSATVSPVSGTTYTATVTDARGCRKSFNKFVNVVDVRCGNKGNKVVICKRPPGNPANAHAICVSADAVAAQLASGSYLGACAATAAAAVPELAEEAAPVLSIRAYPNPSAAGYTIDVKGREGLSAELVVYDVLGKQVERRTLSSGSFVIGANYRPGVYFAELRQGKERASVKLIRQ